MAIKHKVLQDFQFIQVDKKITILKAKTLLIDFTYQTKNDSVIIPKDIIQNNPEYFQFIDWKMDFLTELKSLKVPQATVVSKKLTPFIENLLNENTPAVIQNNNDELVSELQNQKNNLKSQEEEISKLKNKILDLESKLKTKEEEMQNIQPNNSEDSISKSKIIGIIEGFKSRGFASDLFNDFMRQL
jgi:hypothetical protein